MYSSLCILAVLQQGALSGIRRPDAQAGQRHALATPSGVSNSGEQSLTHGNMASDNPAIDLAALGEMARTCACLNFRKGSRSVTQFFDQTLAPTGLRSTQLVILIAAELFSPSSIARLARELVMDRSTLTRNLRPLLNLGYLRLAVAKDGKHKSVEVTPEGRAALLNAAPYWERSQRYLVERFGNERWERLIQDLGSVVEATRAGEIELRHSEG
jgi:DNA-binding MarR family transcriptional regulator